MQSGNLFDAEFFDVERVEVLRGPQGTLYGRNATGGLVNVITAKPTDTFEAEITGELGNYSTQKLRGMINLPIVGDKLAVRVAGNYLKRDGYVTNTFNDHKVDDRDLYSTRVSVMFNPSTPCAPTSCGSTSRKTTAAPASASSSAPRTSARPRVGGVPSGTARPS